MEIVQEAVFIALRKSISHERLEAYRRNPRDCDLDLLTRYAWNIAISETLYPSLNNFEVALRNHLHQSIAKISNFQWLTDSSILISQDQTTVQKAQKQLQKRNKPQHGGHLVAELNLGFWTALSYSKYEQSVWRKLSPLSSNGTIMYAKATTITV